MSCWLTVWLTGLTNDQPDGMRMGYWVECFVEFAGRFHNWVDIRQAGLLAKLLARPDCLLNQQLDIIQTEWIHSFLDIRLNCDFYSWLILSLGGFYTDWLTIFMPGQPVGLKKWLVVWLIGCMACWLPYRFDVRPTSWLNSLLFRLMFCWTVDWLAVWQAGLLTGCILNQPVGKLADLLTNWLVY